MLEKEVFAHLVFLLSAVKRFYLLYIHNDKFPKDWTFYKMHSMPPHYSFILQLTLLEYSTQNYERF